MPSREPDRPLGFFSLDVEPEGDRRHRGARRGQRRRPGASHRSPAPAGVCARARGGPAVCGVRRAMPVLSYLCEDGSRLVVYDQAGQPHLVVEGGAGFGFRVSGAIQMAGSCLRRCASTSSTSRTRGYVRSGRAPTWRHRTSRATWSCGAPRDLKPARGGAVLRRDLQGRSSSLTGLQDGRSSCGRRRAPRSPLARSARMTRPARQGRRYGWVSCRPRSLVARVPRPV